MSDESSNAESDYEILERLHKRAWTLAIDGKDTAATIDAIVKFIFESNNKDISANAGR